MNTTIEHLGTTPGHADQNCGPCRLLMKLTGWYCNNFDLPLRSNQHGAIRAHICIRDQSLNTEKERND